VRDHGGGDGDAQAGEGGDQGHINAAGELGGAVRAGVEVGRGVEGHDHALHGAQQAEQRRDGDGQADGADVGIQPRRLAVLGDLGGPLDLRHRTADLFEHRREHVGGSGGKLLAQPVGLPRIEASGDELGDAVAQAGGQEADAPQGDEPLDAEGQHDQRHDHDRPHQQAAREEQLPQGLDAFAHGALPPPGPSASSRLRAAGVCWESGYRALSSAYSLRA